MHILYLQIGEIEKMQGRGFELLQETIFVHIRQRMVTKKITGRFHKHLPFHLQSAQPAAGSICIPQRQPAYDNSTAVTLQGAYIYGAVYSLSSDCTDSSLQGNCTPSHQLISRLPWRQADRYPPPPPSNPSRLGEGWGGGGWVSPLHQQRFEGGGEGKEQPFLYTQNRHKLGFLCAYCISETHHSLHDLSTAISFFKYLHQGVYGRNILQDGILNGRYFSSAEFTGIFHG